MSKRALFYFTFVVGAATGPFGPTSAAADVACDEVLAGPGFESFYSNTWNCSQGEIDDMWSRFSFEQEDWDGQFGYTQPCDNLSPLSRTFNGLQVLKYSATSSPHCVTESLLVAAWAYCWSANEIEELDGTCACRPSATVVEA